MGGIKAASVAIMVSSPAVWVKLSRLILLSRMARYALAVKSNKGFRGSPKMLLHACQKLELREIVLICQL